MQLGGRTQNNIWQILFLTSRNRLTSPWIGLGNLAVNLEKYIDCYISEYIYNTIQVDWTTKYILKDNFDAIC